MECRNVTYYGKERKITSSQSPKPQSPQRQSSVIFHLTFQIKHQIKFHSLSIFLIMLFQIFFFPQKSLSQNQQLSRYIPYYSSFFYQALKMNTRDEDMKKLLRSVLMKSHILKPRQLDDIIDNCPPGNKQCYSQVVVGYERARLFLMGFFYLVKTGNEYAIKEKYCNKLYGRQEFEGRVGPAPQRIPDTTVVNVEHTWPQSLFNRQIDKESQKSDLHHLFPTDSEVNRIRGNQAFGKVFREYAPLKCKSSRMGVGSRGNRYVFEPPDEHKGHVARALFYFSVRYNVSLDSAQEYELKVWNSQFPVDTEELQRNEEIFKVQGNRNPFIDYPELALLISDF